MEREIFRQLNAVDAILEIFETAASHEIQCL